jgi:acetyl esterase
MPPPAAAGNRWRARRRCDGGAGMSGHRADRPQEPEILAYQAEVEALYPADAVAAPIAQQRRWYDALCRSFDAPLPTGLAIADAAAPGPAGSVPLRRYRPTEATATALLLYLHGGGFVVGGLDSHHAICAEISAVTGAELVAVDYRLAPEHRYPAALTDALTALLAVGAVGRPVLAMGDSAGGNLAAAAALALRDGGRGGAAATALLQAAGWDGQAALPRLIGQALIYPGLGGELDQGSFVEMADALALTTADIRYYRDLIGSPAGDPYGRPLAATDLAGLPPAYITAAFFDPLRDDGRLYAARLARAGVNVAYREEPQMIHAWLRARHRSPGAAAAFAALCRGVRALLDGA